MILWATNGKYAYEFKSNFITINLGYVKVMYILLEVSGDCIWSLCYNETQLVLLQAQKNNCQLERLVMFGQTHCSWLSRICSVHEAPQDWPCDKRNKQLIAVDGEFCARIRTVSSRDFMTGIVAI